MEFEKLTFLVEELNNDPSFMTKWTSSGRQVPVIFKQPKTAKIPWKDDVLDKVEFIRSEKWFFYLENPPSVDITFMPTFFSFQDRLMNNKVGNRRTESQPII